MGQLLSSLLKRGLRKNLYSIINQLNVIKVLHPKLNQVVEKEPNLNGFEKKKLEKTPPVSKNLNLLVILNPKLNPQLLIRNS